MRLNHCKMNYSAEKNQLFSAMKIHFLQEITLPELMKATLPHFKHHHFHLGCLSGCASVRYTYQRPKCSKINGSNQLLRTVNSQAQKINDD